MFLSREGISVPGSRLGGWGLPSPPAPRALSSRPSWNRNRQAPAAPRPRGPSPGVSARGMGSSLPPTAPVSTPLPDLRESGNCGSAGAPEGEKRGGRRQGAGLLGAEAQT